MNDTHGETGKGWYGFDLDGTLAKYDKWEGIDHIGRPVKQMVDLIKKMHDEGKVVKILTARVAPKEKPEIKPNPYLENHLTIESPDDMPWAVHAEAWTAREFIQDWCYRVLGFVPDIVYQKDHLMLELYDDRVKQVVPNEGLLVEDLYRECGEMPKEVHSDNGWLLAELNSKINRFISGLWTGALSVILIFAGIEVDDTWFKQKEPARVRFEAAHKVLCDLVNDWPEGSQSIRTSEGEAK